MLLSFSSGLPLALVWILIPAWMRAEGVDIRIVGLVTLTHLPWTLKMLWSPLMDRYPLGWLGRRRGWMAVTQIALFVLTLSMAGLDTTPETAWVILSLTLAVAFASASQDIVYDAYAVDVLRPEEQGVAAGAKIAVYRAAMLIGGSVSITLAAFLSWPVVCALQALLYLPMLLVTFLAREPEVEIPTPPSLRDAVWRPFLGFLGRHRALEILAFVLFYKLADSLSQSLLRPFLIDMGYNEIEYGVAMGTVGFICTLAGTLLGGVLTTAIGMGHSLWIFGFLQIFSNLGYILIIWSGGSTPVMYGAMGFETFTTGLGMGAFGALLMRITQKRFSATQYALLSSLFALSRVFAGPVTGFLVHAAGWEAFFWFTMIAGVPGLILLARFVPPGTREPIITVEAPRYREPLGTAALAARGVAGGLAGMALALLIMAGLVALETGVQGEGSYALTPHLVNSALAGRSSRLRIAVGGFSRLRRGLRPVDRGSVRGASRSHGG